MAKGRNDFSSSVIRRKDLRKPKELSDEALLEQAKKMAEIWQAGLQKQKRADSVNQEVRRGQP